MRNLTATEARNFNECAERNLKRLDNAIKTLKQTHEQLKSQQDQMLKDDTSALCLRAIDLIGYSDKVQRVVMELNTASSDMEGIGSNFHPQDKAVS